jgi:hypothetical protein
MLRGALLAVALGLAVGCAGPVASVDGNWLQRCEQSGGWWHPNELFGGYCEYQGTGFP